MSLHEIICLERAEFRSSLWERTIELRDEVLRRPLGLSFSSEDLDQEAGDVHCAVTDQKGALVGCLVLTPMQEGRVRMRQVAVRTDRQRNGIGRILVHWSEDLARSLGYDTMVLHARESAVPFYLGLGYRVVGEEFFEVSILHRYMVRDL